jgi:hypothetical protein
MRICLVRALAQYKVGAKPTANNEITPFVRRSFDVQMHTSLKFIGDCALSVASLFYGLFRYTCMSVRRTSHSEDVLFLLPTTQPECVVGTLKCDFIYRMKMITNYAVIGLILLCDALN